MPGGVRERLVTGCRLVLPAQDAHLQGVQEGIAQAARGKLIEVDETERPL